MDAEAWNERYAGSEPVWSLTPNLFVESEIGGPDGLPPGTALDLAAGEGRNAIWLASRGWRVQAVDFAEAGLERGRALAREAAVEVEWVRADVTAWSAAEPVDLVVVAYLQLPPDDRLAAIRQAWDSLRPGGTLLWVAHDSSNIAEGTGGPQDPDVLMTAEDVLADLDSIAASYDVVRAERVERAVADGHGEDETRTALDCLVRVVRTD